MTDIEGWKAVRLDGLKEGRRGLLRKGKLRALQCRRRVMGAGQLVTDGTALEGSSPQRNS